MKLTNKNNLPSLNSKNISKDFEVSFGLLNNTDLSNDISQIILSPKLNKSPSCFDIDNSRSIEARKLYSKQELSHNLNILVGNSTMF